MTSWTTDAGAGTNPALPPLAVDFEFSIEMLTIEMTTATMTEMAAMLRFRALVRDPDESALFRRLLAARFFAADCFPMDLILPA